ncbi:hypothetical protein [Pseudoduganella chitinolytica]|uniref:Uncharacterized protein n=1 Tax=Pseudoduganella chitinolytica TaxID=34070 RepID=A0ABY8BGW4_9BURK|nr:hypothetical protein [Pseudoduganella chitinolytica]WEF34916.1 hypothetical protein PX653_09190 [Pseudoduganella chitinolytica]
MHALIRTVLQLFRLRPRSAAPANVAAAETGTERFLSEHSFLTEPEAMAFADGLVAQGYRVNVQHDPYDYCWSVEVFEGELPGPA